MRPKQFIRRWASALVFICLPGVAQNPSNRQQQIEVHKRQAETFLKQQRPDLAIPEFRALVALDPANLDARANLGVLLFFQNDYGGAIPYLQSALKLRPVPFKIQALLGMAEKRTGNILAARTNLESAFPKLQEEKIRLQTGMELIEIYNAAGDLDKAAATVGILRSLYPTNVEVLYTSYRIYSDLAGESMLSLSVVAPTSARMHQVMAHELARQGHITEAISNYREALKTDPNLPGLHFELAEMLNSSQLASDQAEAEAEYKAALAVNQFDEKSECRLGDLAARRGDLDGAFEHYSRAVQLQPNDAEADVDLAKVLMQRNQPEKAEPLLKHAVQVDPTLAVAHFRLSTLYRQTGRTDDAKRELEEFQKYKAMKEKLNDIYREMRLEPAKETQDQNDSRN